MEFGLKLSKSHIFFFLDNFLPNREQNCVISDKRFLQKFNISKYVQNIYFKHLKVKGHFVRGYMGAARKQYG